MKILSEKRALERLREIQTEFAMAIRSRYEHRAKSCSACETPGACCLDEHFVNIRVSRIEARLIEKTLQKLPESKQTQIYERIEETIKKYRLLAGNAIDRTYACPLYEKGTGCLVHNEGKPLPCINHACYEREEDLPPDRLLDEQEMRVSELNIKTYGRDTAWLPLPVAISRNIRK